MEELIEKVEILKDELDKNKSIVNIKKLNKKIMEDKELINLLEKYKNTNNINVKEEEIEEFLEEGNCTTEITRISLDDIKKDPFVRKSTVFKSMIKSLEKNKK